MVYRIKNTLLQHICMNNDKHSLQMGNDLQALHSKMLKEQLLFQLLGRKWSVMAQNALEQLFQREHKLLLQ